MKMLSASSLSRWVSFRVICPPFARLLATCHLRRRGSGLGWYAARRGEITVTRFQILACAAIAMSSSVTAQNAPQSLTRAALTAKLDENFKAVDTNHDGFLSASELQAAQGRDLQKAQAQARAQLQVRFNQLDTNKDGKLTFDEFAAIGTVKANATPAQILQQLDTNHDGKVSADEFRAPRVAAFNKADLNHDGTVTAAEAQSAQAGGK